MTRRSASSARTHSASRVPKTRAMAASSFDAHRRRAGVTAQALPVRRPDFVIGPADNPYLLRWWLLRTPWCYVYLHKILRDDDDRALHDHPWDNMSLILRGAYQERLLDTYGYEYSGPIRSAGSVIRRAAATAHRLLVVRGPVWTLFVTGPPKREWGFLCPQGWRHHDEFTDPLNPGLPGKGCD